MDPDRAQTVSSRAPARAGEPDIGGRDFSGLARTVGGRLLRVQAPSRACSLGGHGPGCAAAMESLRNPYAVEDDPGAFHTTGWFGAYDAGHSPVSVAAESAADIAAAVSFAPGMICRDGRPGQPPGQSAARWCSTWACPGIPAWQVSRMQAIAELRGWAPLIALEIPYNLIGTVRDLIPMAGHHRPEPADLRSATDESSPARRRS